MIFEVLTTSLMGGLALNAYVKRKGLATNDSGKIQRIISLSGLNVKDGKDTLTTQLIRKKQYDWGWEYAYRIPLGRSYDDYLAKSRVLEDGLNNRRQRITVADLKALQLDGNIIADIKALYTRKLTERKEIEVSFDGLLKIRVYNEPLPSLVPFQQGTGWRVPVGVTRDKNTFKYHDFERTPHMIIGGATRYGKSNFINGMLTSLIRSNPDHVKLFLVDLKGGIELCDYESIKQTLSIAYEPEEALVTLQHAYNEMRTMQKRVRALGKKNVQEAGIKERYFIIIDEVGELNPDEAIDKKDIKKDGVIIHKSEKTIKEECQRYMSQIARLGAGLGFRQILASQYTTGDVIPRQCKQNADAKLAFRVQSEVASRVVLDGGGAELLPEIVGRAIYQTASNREILQTPLVTSTLINETLAPHYVKKEAITLEKAAVEPTRRIDTVTFEAL